MNMSVDRDELNDALRGCGSSWSAEQAHGLLCSRISVLGSRAAVDWLRQVLDGADSTDAPAGECAALLELLFAETHKQLTERQSEFVPLLPDDAAAAEERAAALASWSEGFLHGLVSDVRSETLKAQLADEPLCDIIRDLLEMTRATAGDDADDTDEAYIELVEYLRVAVQLTYEVLAQYRAAPDDRSQAEQDEPLLH
ncbi:MAG: YecA family protein [Gammaproteobacteria bacterium]|nr:YecA family protein [Gammaproteobacteria bacterium]